MRHDERAEYVRYRLESARKTFDAARVLSDHGHWNSAVNRLYYALFYAVNALLVIHGIRTKSHSATKGQFSAHFVKTGRFDKRFGRLLAELFDNRQKGDYENIYDFSPEKVEPLFPLVEEMITEIE